MFGSPTGSPEETVLSPPSKGAYVGKFGTITFKQIAEHFLAKRQSLITHREVLAHSQRSRPVYYDYQKMTTYDYFRSFKIRKENQKRALSSW